MSRPWTLLAIAATALLLTAVSSAAQEVAEVAVVDIGYEPTEATVDAGGTVTWTQTGSLPHTVTADDGSFDSHPDCSGGTSCMAMGDTFVQTFEEPGEHPYYCRIHGGPGGVGMSGVVVVTAAGTEVTPTEAATPTEEATPTEATPTATAAPTEAASPTATASPTQDTASGAELPQTGTPIPWWLATAAAVVAGGGMLLRRSPGCGVDRQ